ncbi:hypothetical protein AGLY_008134 [Aphis glycines]|uniref:Uncharacterized protein n=1 Tax=Aphis glycines TaxID=307491 RepID=A0A6G0TKZ0_APHGL|nr:hypothetical protein AGLY_008134 [Aphis glycines]
MSSRAPTTGKLDKPFSFLSWNIISLIFEGHYSTIRPEEDLTFTELAQEAGRFNCIFNYKNIYLESLHIFNVTPKYYQINTFTELAYSTNLVTDFLSNDLRIIYRILSINYPLIFINFNRCHLCILQLFSSIVESKNVQPSIETAKIGIPFIDYYVNKHGMSIFIHKKKMFKSLNLLFEQVPICQYAMFTFNIKYFSNFKFITKRIISSDFKTYASFFIYEIEN